MSGTFFTLETFSLLFAGIARLGNERRVYSRVGTVQSRLSLPLHLALVKNATSMPTRQPRMGLPEVSLFSVYLSSHHLFADTETEFAPKNNKCAIVCDFRVNMNRLTRAAGTCTVIKHASSPTVGTDNFFFLVCTFFLGFLNILAPNKRPWNVSAMHRRRVGKIF